MKSEFLYKKNEPTDRQEIYTGGQAGKQTEIHTDRQGDRQTDRQTDRTKSPPRTTKERRLETRQVKVGYHFMIDYNTSRVETLDRLFQRSFPLNTMKGG